MTLVIRAAARNENGTERGPREPELARRHLVTHELASNQSNDVLEHLIEIEQQTFRLRLLRQGVDAFTISAARWASATMPSRPSRTSSISAFGSSSQCRTLLRWIQSQKSVEELRA
jgi:hypothetical protein